MPTVNNRGRLFWGLAFGSSPGGQWPVRKHRPSSRWRAEFIPSLLRLKQPHDVYVVRR